MNPPYRWVFSFPEAQMHLIFVILALVCFILAAAGVAVPRVQLGWLGAAFYTIAALT